MRSLLLVLLLAAAASADRPNLLLVTLDTTRADHLTPYGYPLPTSPNLEALAKRGTLFRSAYTPVPITLPAHASIMTGLLPVRHGVRHNGFFSLGREHPVLAERLAAAGYATGAFVSGAVLKRSFGLDRGFGRYDDAVDARTRERPAGATAGAAIAWLKTVRPPFFAWVHFFDPHNPYEPSGGGPPGLSPYDGEIARMDAGVGMLLAWLRESGREADTLVVAAGDHGEMLGEHDEPFHGIFLYEASVRVPLIAAGPGVRTGAEVEGPAALMDLFPTLLEAAGLVPPPSDGTGLKEALAKGLWRRPDPWLPLESYYPFFEYGWAPVFGLTNGEKKAVRAPRREFYDLRTDPREERNRFDPASPLAAALLKRIEAAVAADPLWTGGIATRAPLSEEEVKGLQALGYLQGGSVAPRLSPSAASLDPKDGVVLLKRIEEAQEVYQKGNIAGARDRLLAVLESNPDNPFALGRAGGILLDLGYHGDAAAFIRKAIALYPAASEMDYLYLSRALFGAGRKEAALKAAEESLVRSPGFEPALGMRAHILFSLGRAEEAEKVVAASVATDTTDQNLLYYAGCLALGRRDYPAARGYFHRLLAVTPGHRQGLHQMAAVAAEEGKFEDAARYLERVIQLGTPDYGTLMQLGALYLSRLDKPDKAEPMFRRAVSIAPNSGERLRASALLQEAREKTGTLGK